MKSAKLHVELPGRTELLTDGSFPFEFTLPLKPGENALKLSFEAVSATGQLLRSTSIHLTTP